MSKTLATESDLDIDALEEAAYAEIEGVELDDDQGDSDMEGGAEEEVDFEDDPTLSAEDDLPDDEDGLELEDEDVDAENSTLDVEADDDDISDDQEEEDASGEEELEDLAKGLTDKNAEARIVSAQKRMHDATMELSTARKERDSLAEKLEAIQKERDQLLNDIEQGSAKPMYDRVRDELLEDLSDEAKDFYDMNPEALEIEVRKELRSRKKDAPVAKGNDSSEPEQAEGKLSKAEKDWNKAILNDIPNYYTEIETPRFQKFIESNKSLLSQVNRTYDRLDPEGSRVLFKHYYKWQELASRKAKNKPKISSRPRTRARTNPSSRGRSSESREAIEEEFERSLR